MSRGDGVAAIYGVPEEGKGRTIDGRPLEPGRNVDRIDVEAGLRELAACGYDDPRTVMVIDYALTRWKRGEEAQAQRGAIDKSFHGIDLTSWTRVLAAALAGAKS